MKKYGLKLKLPKCQLQKEETNYLGFIINRERVKPGMDKVETRKKQILEPPTVRRKVRGFTDTIDYDKRIIAAFTYDK